MRLIKECDIILDGTATRQAKEKEAFAKLEKLEEIEEELGVDLLLLYAVVKQQKIYTFSPNFPQDGVFEWDMVMVDIPNKRILFEDSDDEYKNDLNEWLSKPLNEYGVSWSIRKEDFE